MASATATREKVDDNGLLFAPQDVRDGVWYYEEPKGIVVVHEVRDAAGAIVAPTQQVLIPWRMLRASLERKDRGERARSRKR